MKVTKLMVNKVVYTLIGWFLVGLIIGKIVFGYFEVFLGILYIFYPIYGLFLFVMANDSGTQKAFAISSLTFGVLAFIYILIPISISFIIDKTKNKPVNDGNDRGYKGY